MSLPPQILRIKRKAEDVPVDSLYIEQSNKRQHIAAQNFVFRRITPTTPQTSIVPLQRATSRDHKNETYLRTARSAANSGVPQVLATQPGDENTLLLNQGQRNKNKQRTSIEQTPWSPPPRHVLPQSTVRSEAQQPRRFHLFLPTRNGTAEASASGAGFNRRKRTATAQHDGTAVALFVEEGAHKRQKAQSQSQSDDTGNQRLAASTSQSTSTDDVSGRIRKRPGAGAAVSRSPALGTRLSGDPADSESHASIRAALMNYALEEQGDAQTYALQDSGQVHDAMDVDKTSPVDNEEYIFDTYVRQPNPHGPKPSSSMDTFASPASNDSTIGFLVIPESSSADFFYTPTDDEDEKDEGDWDSEQDDENAENYYGADYPEEEERSDNGRAYWGGGDEFEIGWGDEEESLWTRKKKEWGWGEDTGRPRDKLVSGDPDRSDSADEDF